MSYGNAALEGWDNINATANLYSQNCRKQTLIRALKTTVCCLSGNGLVAAPFDKELGICIKKNATYHEKLRLITEGEQFVEFSQDTRGNAKLLALKKNSSNKPIKAFF